VRSPKKEMIKMPGKRKPKKAIKVRDLTTKKNPRGATCSGRAGAKSGIEIQTLGSV
jgi:hypothetical protein